MLTRKAQSLWTVIGAIAVAIVVALVATGITHMLWPQPNTYFIFFGYLALIVGILFGIGGSLQMMGVGGVVWAVLWVIAYFVHSI